MDELEQILERHLRGTAAPEELWDRIQSPAEVQARGPRRQMVWALATALLVLAALWGWNARGEGLGFRNPEMAQNRGCRPVNSESGYGAANPDATLRKTASVVRTDPGPGLSRNEASALGESRTACVLCHG